MFPHSPVVDKQKNFYSVFIPIGAEFEDLRKIVKTAGAMSALYFGYGADYLIPRTFKLGKAFKPYLTKTKSVDE